MYIILLVQYYSVRGLCQFCAYTCQSEILNVYGLVPRPFREEKNTVYTCMHQNILKLPVYCKYFSSLKLLARKTIAYFVNDRPSTLIKAIALR